MLVAAPKHLDLKPHYYSPPRSSSTAAENTIPAGEDDFAFDYREELERTSLSAEELFHGGKIKSFQFLQLENSQNDGNLTESEKTRCSLSQIKSPNHDLAKTELHRGRGRALSHGNREELERNSLSAEELFHGGKIRSLHFSQLQNSPNDENLTESEKPRCLISQIKSPIHDLAKTELHRGRVASSHGNRVSRSLSPARVSSYPWEKTEDDEYKKEMVSFKGSISRRWRLMDLLLFRSSSEGRTEHAHSNCSVLKSGRELQYYTVSRAAAAAEGLRKRTFLPYKKGILFYNGY